jgi:transcription-repair coupling factor (superfamily II helicase)
MARMAEALGFFMPEAEVLRLPAWDVLPYDRVSPNPRSWPSASRRWPS